MKRTLFFWLDKLKVSRTERRAISYLLMIFLALMIINSVVQPTPSFDAEHYRELDAQFKRRIALMNGKEQDLKARYSGRVSTTSSDTTTHPDSSAATGTLMDINRADAATLQQLNGIGDSYAARIVAYREDHGAFTSKEQLLKVKGIGPARLRNISKYIMLGDSVAATNREEGIKAEPPVKKEHQTVDAAEQPLIDINKANAETLEQLTGIGPAYARRIMEYRQKNGLFKSKEELLKIKGIGKKRLANIKPFIKLTGEQ